MSVQLGSGGSSILVPSSGEQVRLATMTLSPPAHPAQPAQRYAAENLPGTGEFTPIGPPSPIERTETGPSLAGSRFSVPLKVLLVAVLCVFAIGPAVGLWMGSWRTGQDALSGLQDLSTSSVKVDRCFSSFLFCGRCMFLSLSLSFKR